MTFIYGPPKNFLGGRHTVLGSVLILIGRLGSDPHEAYCKSVNFEMINLHYIVYTIQRQCERSRTTLSWSSMMQNAQRFRFLVRHSLFAARHSGTTTNEIVHFNACRFDLVVDRVYHKCSFLAT